MKPQRRTAAATLVLALAFAAPAAEAQRWELGAKTGLASVGVSKGEFLWNGSNAASAAFLRGGISDRLSIVSELVISRRVGVSTLPASTVSLVAEYMELPLLLQARIGSLYGFAPFAVAGPSLVLRVRCRLRFVGGGISTDDDCDNARYVSNDVDYAINGGVGLARRFGFLTLSVEGRYAVGVRQNVLPTGVPSARAHGWTALAGFTVPFSLSRTVPAPGRLAPVIAEAPPPGHMPQRVEVPADAPVAVEDLMDRRISVDAADVELRELFAGISRAVNVPIEVAPDVTGRVSIALRSVTVASALASIVDKAGLAMTRGMESGTWTVRIHRVPRSAP